MVAELNKAKRLIQASYSHRSAEYARFAGDLVYSYLSAPLAEAIAPLGDPVLDVAGGTGAFTRRLNDAVVADISLNQLVVNPVKRRVQSDAELLPFMNDSFAVAASAFGINHFPSPDVALSEMSRVGRAVGLLTWVRPEDNPFLPKVIVLDAIARHTAVDKSEAGQLVDEMSQATGSPPAIRSLLEGADLRATVELVSVDIPWPGTQRFIDYRLSMMGPDRPIDDLPGLRREAAAAIDALSQDERRWSADLVLGVGTRR
jgi:ubiquinone/menaquinone biosynthesis C-methylase UbiE